MARCTLLSILVVLGHANASTTAGRSVPTLFRNRRAALGLAGSVAAGAVAGRVAPVAAAEPTVKVYFGAGCFWHVQHEFVGEEVAALRRSPAQITAVSGYAGGQRLGPNNKVCYHNMQSFADYGKLGHAEAVEVTIPESAFPRFCKKYFDLFGERGYRHDPQDRGGEYRSVLGLPGGQDSKLFDIVRQAALDSPGGMKLYAGRGDEPDTIGDKAVLVYDSNKFPFYPGELYHQFHNDFAGPAYGKAYNDIIYSSFKSGKIANTGCPDMDPSKLSI